MLTGQNMFISDYTYEGEPGTVGHVALGKQDKTSRQIHIDVGRLILSLSFLTNHTLLIASSYSIFIRQARTFHPRLSDSMSKSMVANWSVKRELSSVLLIPSIFKWNFPKTLPPDSLAGKALSCKV